MFSIYAKAITPESSPILGPAQGPNNILEPLDSTSNQQQQQRRQQQQQQQQQQRHILDEMGGIGLLCACCSRIRDNSNTIINYDIAPLSSISSRNSEPISDDVLEKCNYETHYTHYNYRAITPRQMPPF